MSRSLERPALAFVALALAALALLAAPAAAQQKQGRKFPELGRAATAAEIKGWDIDVRGDDGKGLPKGKGSAKDGEELYAQHCAACHGVFGEGEGRWPEIIGGKGTLTSADPRKTVGSYWPYAPTLFDYVRRAMPFTMPNSLTADETYAIVAYVLSINDIVPDTAVLDETSLPKVRMPNRDGFLVGDPRPDVKAEPCMTKCRSEAPRVTSDLAQRLGVTPGRPSE
ncbi:MAG: cytochrome c [Alphaproteobacteria bacterium]|nr:cytochrome c [Alphaproteobacteria bacterium]